VNEHQLLEAARGGDENAFARLVEPHRGALHAHCYRMLGSVPDAEDALQEALLSAWRGLPRFEGRSSLRSWLFTIATNACLGAIKRRPKRVLPIDYGPLDAGLGLMPWGAMTVLVPQIAGRLIGRLGERPFIVTGLTVNALAMIWIALIAEPGVAYWQIAIPLVLSGTGIAMSIPAAQSSVLTSVAPPDIGKASGTFSTMRQLGGAFGVAVLVAVFASAGSYSSPQEFSDGFVAASAAGAGLSLMGALAGATLPGRRETRDLGLADARAVPVLETEGH
jgi:MFS family permease